MSEGTNKRVFYKGIPLWKGPKYWRPTPNAQGQGGKMGLSRKKGRMAHRSPNFLWDITVHTSIPPIEANVIEDLGRQETLTNIMGQLQAILVEASTPLGDLSWVQDKSEVLDVTSFVAPGSYPGASIVSYNDGTKGFTPGEGDYVLFREPVGMAGFVTQVTSAGVGTIGAVLQEAIDATWEVYLVRFFYPQTAFVNVGAWEAASQIEDAFAMDIPYLFRSESEQVQAAKYNFSFPVQ